MLYSIFSPKIGDKHVITEPKADLTYVLAPENTSGQPFGRVTFTSKVNGRTSGRGVCPAKVVLVQERSAFDLLQRRKRATADPDLEHSCQSWCSWNSASNTGDPLYNTQ
ncbi:hypothetical protein CDAR_589321 [Caerostris darwini]|uniref:Uncharacterized protein n=1 Tax=Caerostris darwini TaxID=1538125 RepID=A0AAV4T662_9ARAC|nr:hypothetical protein CDAR_589321 [Caerostris darwini]